MEALAYGAGTSRHSDGMTCWGPAISLLRRLVARDESTRLKWQYLLVQEYDCWNQGTEFCHMVLLVQGHCKPAVTKVR